MTRIIAAIVLLASSGAVAQEKLKEGDTRTGAVAICEKVEDAATLIGLTTRYGTNTGMGFIKEPNNSCDFGPTTFKVGTVELSGMRDQHGAEWMVLAVTVEDKPHYIVLPSVMVATPASY